MSKLVSSGSRSHTSRQVSHGYLSAPPTAHVYPKLPCQISTFRVKAAIAIVRDLRRHVPNTTGIAWTPANLRQNGGGSARKCERKTGVTWTPRGAAYKATNTVLHAPKGVRGSDCYVLGPARPKQAAPKGLTHKNRCHMDA